MKMVKYRKMTKKCETKELIVKQSKLNYLNKPEEIVINRPKPGYRDDNKWHLYYPDYLKNYENSSDSREREERLNDDVDDLIKWEKTLFLDKSYWGYYCWPAKLDVNLNKRKCYVYDDDDEDVVIFCLLYTSRRG